MADEIIIPTVHLNGTPLAEFERVYEAAYTATGDLLDKLREAQPNGRDYLV